MPNTILQVFPYADFYKYRAIASNSQLTKYNFIESHIELPKDYEDEIRRIEVERNIPIDRVVLFNQDGYARFKLENEKVNTDFTPWLEYFFGDMILREENYNLTWSIEKELMMKLEFQHSCEEPLSSNIYSRTKIIIQYLSVHNPRDFT